jgi:glycosyltransferase involved in cell wall biosynthesis
MRNPTDNAPPAPTPFIRGLLRVKYAAARAGRLVVGLGRWTRIALAGRAEASRPVVSYGHASVPRPDQPAHGGLVKMQCLATVWPSAPRRYNILYLGSSCLPRDWRAQVALARRKGARIVLNQDGIASPSWCPGDLERVNGPLRRVLERADYVFYQSAFCKRAADRYLGERRERFEILHNPVDTRRFTPAGGGAPRRPLVLLSVGTINHAYRFEAAVKALASVRRRLPEARLIFAGRLNWSSDHRAIERHVRALLEATGTVGCVEIAPTFTQREAPDVYRPGHILLHTQFNDNCPTVVLEAMACGLPVVYSASGGVPELVGEDAGVGVAARETFDELIVPDAEALARAVLRVDADWARYSQAARRRAVERFDVAGWIERHRVALGELLARE